MKRDAPKVLFWVILAIMLPALLLISRDAGISGDEEVHLKQSEKVYQYFASFGENKDALNTPKTHLKYYGQSYDNLATILIHWFKIDDVFGFRHYLCSFAGWLTILVSALFAVYLSGYTAGILVLVIFAVSPTFLGHAQNNLKDIPFALAYISGVFFIVRVVSAHPKASFLHYFLLTIAIAFAISIRAGGLLLLLYLIFFFIVHNSHIIYIERQPSLKYIRFRLLIIIFVAVLAYFLGLSLWPYALQNPFTHPWKSYQVMARFPTTIRQIFEGQLYWSDFLPWYYLPKIMFITIPLLVFAGIVCFVLFIKKIVSSGQIILFGFLLFTIIFPPFFAVVHEANLYGSWRHFLFIYPAIVIIAALGYSHLFQLTGKIMIRVVISAGIIALAFHPLKFMIANHPYYYLYYNQLVGGIDGAYGNYETDYYYHSMREGANWLSGYLHKNQPRKQVKVGANFSVKWLLRNDPKIQTVYFAWDDRVQNDWDYAIIANSYIHPYQLKNKIWPPKNAIHVIYADKVPVCAILKRETKEDYHGMMALKDNKIQEAISCFEKAILRDPQNEVILYHYAEALQKNGQSDSAFSVLSQVMKIHNQYEPALKLLGKLSLEKGDTANAIHFFDALIQVNNKYFSAYVSRAGLFTEKEAASARNLLKDCLRINSGYRPAIVALANSYRKSNPEIARKYDLKANSIK
jgi:hypothetical protein